jgi:hypothetical protein
MSHVRRLKLRTFPILAVFYTLALAIQLTPPTTIPSMSVWRIIRERCWNLRIALLLSRRAGSIWRGYGGPGDSFARVVASLADGWPRVDGGFVSIAAIKRP